MKELVYHKCWRCNRKKTLPKGESPGFCVCKTNHPYPWITKTEPWPKDESGWVIVLGDKGAQELKGPSWKERPDAWEEPKELFEKVKTRHEKLLSQNSKKEI